MKTFNDLNQPIYICPCCIRTWLTVEVYREHLKIQIKSLEKELNETHMPTKGT